MATSLTCTQDFPTEKGFGGPRRHTEVPRHGGVQCTNVFNNKRYEGKVMTGAIEFTVGKTKIKRTYSVKIGPGATLSNAKGAVIGKGT